MFARLHRILLYLFVVLVVIQLGLFAIHLIPAVQTTPVTLHVETHEATVDAQTDRAAVLFPNDCIVAHWTTANIGGIKVAGSPAIGEGETRSVNEVVLS